MPWGVVAGAVIGGAASVYSANKAEDSAKETAQASKESAELQSQYQREASQLLDPFKGIGEQGLAQSGFLTDPNAQFNFLQNNPLFQMAQAQNQQQTNDARNNLMQMSASRGRLSSGDTLRQLNTLDENSARNLLLSSQGLIADQKNSIGNLLNYGLSTATNQGNLLAGQGATLAGGIMGSQNALNAGTQAQINNANTLAGLGASVATADWSKFGGSTPPPQDNSTMGIV